MLSWSIEHGVTKGLQKADNERQKNQYFQISKLSKIRDHLILALKTSHSSVISVSLQVLQGPKRDIMLTVSMVLLNN